MGKILQSFTLILLLSSARSTIDVFFLLKGARPSSSICDYIFICRVVGVSLQWEANNQSLAGLIDGQAGVVRSSTSGTLQYSAVLLSDQEVGEQNLLTSVLIISTSDSLLEVTCFNDVGSSNSSNNNGISKLDTLITTVVDTSNTIMLQHLFSTLIVQGMNNASQTHALLCTVQSDSQTWKINDRNPFGFSTLNNIGDALPSQPSGRPIAEELTFLHSKNPFVAILFVTGPLPINVSCLSNEHEVGLEINEIIPSTQQTSPTMEYTAPLTFTGSRSSTVEGTDMESTKDASSNNVCVSVIAGSAVVGVVVLIVIIFAAICGIAAVSIRNKRAAERKKQEISATNPAIT